MGLRGYIAAGFFLVGTPELFAHEFFKSSSSRSVNHSFATLEHASDSNVYIKDVKAFIFSDALDQAPVQMRDSVFVGRNSTATLALSNELGGGKIILTPNTIITLSHSGKNNDIPTLNIKQGEIRIVRGPEPAHAVSVESATGHLEKAMEIVPKSQLVISSGEKAFVVTDDVSGAKVSADKIAGLKLVNQSQVAELDKLSDENVQPTSASVDTLVKGQLPTIVALDAIDLAPELQKNIAKVKETKKSKIVEKSEQIQGPAVAPNLKKEESTSQTGLDTDKLKNEMISAKVVRKASRKIAADKASKKVDSPTPEILAPATEFPPKTEQEKSKNTLGLRLNGESAKIEFTDLTNS